MRLLRGEGIHRVWLCVLHGEGIHLGGLLLVVLRERVHVLRNLLLLLLDLLLLDLLLLNLLRVHNLRHRRLLLLERVGVELVHVGGARGRGKRREEQARSVVVRVSKSQRD